MPIPISFRYAGPLLLIAGAAVWGISGIALAQRPDGAAHPAGAPSGAQVYMQARCFACHGEYGYGGAGPRFRENRFVGLTDYVVGQILVGRGIMPSFANTLDNEQIAAVASYVRTSWGNKFGPVKPQQVAQVRQQVQLQPPAGPHLSPDRGHQPSHVPAPPSGPKPPGQALPPESTK